jgi:hypothetical protein
MKQRGRQSAAALVVVEQDSAGISRAAPPSKLTDGEKAVWVATVNDKPTDWFGSSHVAMLVDYCRAVVNADVINAQIKAFDPEWLKTEEGLRRYDRLISMAAKVSGVCNTLARSMRVTHQAIYRGEKVIPKPGRRLWQREPSA